MHPPHLCLVTGWSPWAILKKMFGKDIHHFKLLRGALQFIMCLSGTSQRRLCLEVVCNFITTKGQLWGVSLEKLISKELARNKFGREGEWRKLKYLGWILPHNIWHWKFLVCANNFAVHASVQPSNTTGKIYLGMSIQMMKIYLLLWKNS